MSKGFLFGSPANSTAQNTEFEHRTRSWSMEDDMEGRFEVIDPRELAAMNTEDKSDEKVDI